MAYVLRTTDNAGDLGRAADQNQSVGNDIYFNSLHLVTANPYDPLRTPTSPNASDDELSDSSLNVAWTEVDPDAKTTWTEGEYGLKAVTATSAADNNNGIWKALPAGDFTIWTRVAITSPLVAYHAAGIGLWEDGTSGNDVVWFANMHNGTMGQRVISSFSFTTYTAGSAAKVASFSAGFGMSAWLRVRRTGTNYYFDWSDDGVGWVSTNALAAITFAWVPTKMGLIVDNSNVGANAQAVFSFFRYLPSDVGLYGTMSGQRG